MAMGVVVQRLEGMREGTERRGIRGRLRDETAWQKIGRHLFGRPLTPRRHRGRLVIENQLDSVCFLSRLRINVSAMSSEGLACVQGSQDVQIA